MLYLLHRAQGKKVGDSGVNNQEKSRNQSVLEKGIKTRQDQQNALLYPCEIETTKFDCHFLSPFLCFWFDSIDKGG